MIKLRSSIRLAASLTLLYVLGHDAVLADGSRDDLGRLFLTPAERSHIDKLRQHENSNDLHSASFDERKEPVKRIVVNGLIRRSSGRDSVWVNGKRLDQDRPRADDVVLMRGPDERHRVVVGRPNGNRARLKPGQAWDLGNDQITECGACDASEPEQPADSPE